MVRTMGSRFEKPEAVVKWQGEEKKDSMKTYNLSSSGTTPSKAEK